MPTLERGSEGAPLPADEWVIRLCIREWCSMDFRESRRILPNLFELSSADKSADPPLLSVYAERLCTPAQAWDLLGARPRQSVVVFLKVSDIRNLELESPSSSFPGLDVVWSRAIRVIGGEALIDDRPGSEGHAGILHLSHGSLGRQQRAELRSKLADLATRRFELIPKALAASELEPGPMNGAAE